MSRLFPYLWTPKFSYINLELKFYPTIMEFI